MLPFTPEGDLARLKIVTQAALEQNSPVAVAATIGLNRLAANARKLTITWAKEYVRELIRRSMLKENTDFADEMHQSLSTMSFCYSMENGPRPRRQAKRKRLTNAYKTTLHTVMPDTPEEIPALAVRYAKAQFIFAEVLRKLQKPNVNEELTTILKRPLENHDREKRIILQRLVTQNLGRNVSSSYKKILTLMKKGDQKEIDGEIREFSKKLDEVSKVTHRLPLPTKIRWWNMKNDHRALATQSEDSDGRMLKKYVNEFDEIIGSPPDTEDARVILPYLAAEMSRTQFSGLILSPQCWK